MRNRWFIALAAIGLHISIGSVYAWSVLTRPIMADMGFTLSQTTWTFSLAILMLGLSAGFLGSVSYTHLDVYKRQMKYNTNINQG